MELEYKQTNAYLDANEQKLNDIFNYAKGYIDFLNNSKTEREAVSSGIKMATSFGYTPYTWAIASDPDKNCTITTAISLCF